VIDRIQMNPPLQDIMFAKPPSMRGSEEAARPTAAPLRLPPGPDAMNPLACRLWRIVAWLALLLLAGLARADPPPDAGERIFRQGTLASGEPLQAIRDGGMRMEARPPPA
jgi:hypothetical protein